MREKILRAEYIYLSKYKKEYKGKRREVRNRLLSDGESEPKHGALEIILLVARRQGVEIERKRLLLLLLPLLLLLRLPAINRDSSITIAVHNSR